MYSKNKIIKLANQAEYTVKGIYFIVGNGLCMGCDFVKKRKD